MLDVLGPGHIGDMDKPIDALIQAYEGAEIGQAFDLALDLGPQRVLGFDQVPWVRRDLFHAERDLASRLIDIQHLGFHLIADRDNFRGMADFMRPGHLGDMDEPFDAGFKFDECAVIGQADDTPRDP